MKRIEKAAALAQIERERASSSESVCAMCALTRDASAVASSERSVAVLDRYASREGHVLVIARRHEEHIARLSWAEYEDMQRLAWRLARAASAVWNPQRVFIAALGSRDARATSFPHVHLHVVPLADGGDADRPASVFTWEHGVWVFDDAAEEERMREALARALHATGV